jgi:phage terminase small subunit
MCRSVPEACRRAGYSEKVSYNQFKKPNIQAQIKYLEKQMAIHYVAEQYQVINELSAIAFTGIDDVAEWDAENNHFSIKEMEDISPLAMKAIKSVKNVTHKDGRRTLEVELQDKIPVLNMLMKYMGMLQDENKTVNVVNNLNVNDVDNRIQELLAKRNESKALAPVKEEEFEVIEVDNDGNPIDDGEIIDERIY